RKKPTAQLLRRYRRRPPLLVRCGDGRPRPSNPSERQAAWHSNLLDLLLADGCAIRGFSGLRRFNGSDVLKHAGQALRVVDRLAKTCRLVSACKLGDLLLQCRFLNGRDEIQWCLRRRLAPAKTRHAADHPVIPKCSGFARRTLRMRPQTTIAQPADH